MRKYLVDANPILRYVLKDNENQSKLAAQIFEEARSGKVKIVLEDIIILEVEFVLRKRYDLPRHEICKFISTFIKIPAVEVSDLKILLGALEIYLNKNVDIVDAILYQKSLKLGLEIFSFDKDFSKMAR